MSCLRYPIRLVNELNVKQCFFLSLIAYIYQQHVHMAGCSFLHLAMGRYGPPACPKGHIGLTLPYRCSGLSDFLLKPEVLNVPLNGLHILQDSCLFRICSGPFRVSLMARKKQLLIPKPLEVGSIFLSIVAGIAIST